MAVKKYYGVLFKDGKSEVYEDWGTCRSKIIGVKGVIYKGFPTREEALAFIELAGGGAVKTKGTSKSFQTDIAIYVDGSYRDNIYSYGYVVVDVEKDEALHEQSGKGMDEEAAKLRNVSGEMKGAMEAITYCLSNGIEEVTICYDYSGIEMWALGLWKRNNVFTAAYHDFFQNRKDRLKVHFKKIKGHSGDRWNERADILAKEGLNIS